MRAAALAAVAAALLLGSGPLAAQEPPICPGQGATKAPGWYTAPPGPPVGVYQAAARSGGCEDAQTAQKVAAGLGSWLLLHERSRQALVEQTLRRRRQTETEGTRTLSQTARVVERSTLRKVLERSWVHRQATRWTAEGKAEHFLLLRADTAAVRKVAAGELTGLAEARQESLSKGARPSNADLSWVSLPDEKTSSDRSITEKRSTPTQLRRVVLSWATDPTTWTDSVSRLNRTDAARVGVSLLAPESPRLLAVGAEVRREEDLTVPISGPTSDFHLRDSHLWVAYGLVSFPGQAVPVYAGYRQRSYKVVPADSEHEAVERDERSLVLGLGVPAFTELERTGIQNAYLEAGVWPQFLSLSGGVRLTMVRPALGRLNGLLEVDLFLRRLGRDGQLGTATVVREGDVYLEESRIRTALELEVGGAVAVFGLWEVREATPKLVSNRQDVGYAVVARSAPDIGPLSSDHRLRVGLRVAF